MGPPSASATGPAADPRAPPRRRTTASPLRAPAPTPITAAPMISCRPLRPGEGRHWYFDPTLFPASPGEEDLDAQDAADDDAFAFDAATRRSIHASPYRTHLERLIALDGAYGMFRGRDCLALAAAEPMGNGRTWLLWECLVQDGLRRQGLGRRLLERLAAGLARRGAAALLCQVSPSHEVACRFLAGCGFALAGCDTTGAEPIFFYRLDLAARRRPRRSRAAAEDLPEPLPAADPEAAG